MSAPPRYVPDPDPSQYEPRPIGDEQIAAAVAGAQELLAWARTNGYRLGSIKVGPVELVAIADDFPRRRPISPADPAYEE